MLGAGCSVPRGPRDTDAVFSGRAGLLPFDGSLGQRDANNLCPVPTRSRPRLSPRQVTMLYMRVVLTCPGVWEFSYQRARRHDWINYYFSARDVRSLWTFLHSAVLAHLPAAAPFRSGGTARSTAPGEALCSATRREAATLAFFRQRASGVRGIWSPELAVELAPVRGEFDLPRDKLTAGLGVHNSEDLNFDGPRCRLLDMTGGMECRRRHGAVNSPRSGANGPILQREVPS